MQYFKFLGPSNLSVVFIKSDEDAKQIQGQGYSASIDDAKKEYSDVLSERVKAYETEITRCIEAVKDLANFI